MATPIDYVDAQWEKWQVLNDPERFEHIDTEQLKGILINDLTYASKMDVREYTLYQKWLEVHEKYPTRPITTLFGDDVQLVDVTQKNLVEKVKKNFWMPESPDDYEKLKPKLVLSNGPLAETWNTVRTFSSTMKNNSNIGRNLYYTVVDEVTDKYLGVMCISSDFLDLTPRDTAIGWPRDVKTQQGMINHTAIGSTIVPLQPLGFNYMGGKLLALLCLADTVQNDWKRQYGDVLVGVTTTSLYGNTKSGGLSQYDGLEHWNKMGFSSGSVAFEPSRKTRAMIYDWVKENHTRKYFEWYVATNASGQPFKRDQKNRSLSFTYAKMNVPKEVIKTDHARGIYFTPLYDKTCEFLRGDNDGKDMTKLFDTDIGSISNLWKMKHAKPRIKQLVKKGNVSHESLFYDDLIYLTWEEAKNKYLPQVGR